MCVNDKRRGLVVVVAMVAASCGGGFVPPSRETPPDEAMEVFVTSGGLPGLAVAVIKDRELVYSKVAGVRKRGDVTPVAADDAFHIGSNTKGVTALVAATVVDAGQLTWDAKVGDVLAGVVPVRAEYRAVTLAQLLSHSSGIPEIGGEAELAFNRSTAPTAQQRREIAAATLALNPLWAAGTRFFYSNVNFVVAGPMLEVVTSQSWEVLVTERLFGPLGMTRAGFGGKIGSPKGGKERVVPLTSRLLAAIKGQRHLRGPLVFCRDDGATWTNTTMRAGIKRQENRAGLRITGWHVLRHTFCSHLAMRGAPAKAIQDLAGHQSIAVTNRYMHLAPGALRTAIDLLESATLQASCKDVRKSA